MADGDGGLDVGAIGWPMDDVVIDETHLEEAERGMHEEGGFGHALIMDRARVSR